MNRGERSGAERTYDPVTKEARIAMQAETKEQILSIINRRLAVLLPAVVLSILVLWIMYAQGYPALAYGEVVLILETLMHLVLAVWSALKAILLGIVVFGLLFAFLLPVLIVLRDLWKKRNQPSGASALAPQVPDDMSNSAQATGTSETGLP
jgi:hypothetical protein